MIAAGVPSTGPAAGQFRLVVVNLKNLEAEAWTEMYERLAVQFAALDLLTDPTLIDLIEDKVNP